MSDRIIVCEGRRRITVAPDGTKTKLTIWLRDPPHGQVIATLVLALAERDKLLLELTETKANE